MSRGPGAIPLFGDAYLADTQHLSTEEHGAYLLLMMAAWRQEDCGLPLDDKKLARITGLSSRRWTQIRETILGFWTVENGRIYQRRLRKEMVYSKSRSKAQAEKAAGKWSDGDEPRDDQSASRTRAQRLTAAREKGRHTTEEWEALMQN